MTRAALLALLLLCGCTQLYADRVVLVTPQTYLRAASVDAQGVALVCSTLNADSLSAQAVQYVQHYHQER